MTHFTSTIYGKKLKFLRNQIDATQYAIAANLNMSQQAYAKLERGKINFTPKRIREICVIFNITLHDFAILDDSLLQKQLSIKSHIGNDGDATFNELNKHYEILFLESELRNVKLEQQLKNYKPFQEMSNEDSPPIYVMI